MDPTPYERALGWMYALEAAKGMDFKLERVELALHRLGDPQRRLAALHVAGTNGKGSVAAMLQAVLSHAGHRTGLYTSPHLIRFTERIRIGEEEIAPEDVVSITAEIQRRTTSSGLELTFFEFVTVMAFLHFAGRGVDAAVIEVGLGGRLDATNVIDPVASVITTIGLDHTQFLGGSIAAIAAEKGGVIKPGRPVVLGDVSDEAAAVLQGLATERDATLFRAGRDYGMTADDEPTFEGLGWTLPRLRLGLAGGFQRENAASALATLAAARERFPVSEDAIRAGIASVRWPGRLEVVERRPLTILDGAHNADGTDALCRELPGLIGSRRLHLLFAVMADKDWRPMVERLAPACASVVVTEVLPPRGQAAEPVAELFRRWCPAVCESAPERAWRAVQASAAGEDAILVAGSLFLIGTVYPLCRPSATPRPPGVHP